MFEGDTHRERYNLPQQKHKHKMKARQKLKFQMKKIK